MDVADACCQEVDAEISDLLALFRIRALALADHAVFLAADRSDLCLERHAVVMCDLNELRCLRYVLLDRIV